MSSEWQQEKEMSNIFWQTLIFQLALKLPRWSIRLLLYPIVFFFILVAAKKRRISYHYLAQVLPHTPRIWHVYKHFYWFAAVLLDRIYFLSKQTQLFDVSFINRQATIDSLEKQPAQFFLSGHYGSVEALRSLSIDKYYKIKAVVKLDHNQVIISLLNQLNGDFYKNVIPYEDLKTTFVIYETLKKGIAVGMLADRPIGEGGTLSVKFLNDTIKLPKSIFKMLLRFSFPANLFFSQYQGDNRYQVKCIPFTVKSNDTVQSLAQKFADILAEQCLNSPYNWFNFYSYWQSSDEN